MNDDHRQRNIRLFDRELKSDQLGYAHCNHSIRMNYNDPKSRQLIDKHTTGLFRVSTPYIYFNDEVNVTILGLLQ